MLFSKGFYQKVTYLKWKIHHILLLRADTLFVILIKFNYLTLQRISFQSNYDRKIILRLLRINDNALPLPHLGCKMKTNERTNRYKIWAKKSNWKKRKKEKHIWVGFWLIAFTINLHWVVRVPISSKIKISLFSSKVWLLGPVQ